MIGPILRRAVAGRLPSRREVMLMLAAEGNEYKALRDTAARLTRKMKGEEPSLRGMVMLRPGFQRETVLAEAVRAWRSGCSSILLMQQEEAGELGVTEVVGLIGELKAQTDLQIALCMGERSYDIYATWRQAGADEYLLPHESCNPRRYAELYPGRSPAERLTRYLWLKGLGYRVTGGVRLGLEGQGQEELADELEVLRNAGVTGAVLRPMGPDSQLLRVLAIARLCLPEADLMVRVDDPAIQAEALASGANLVTLSTAQEVIKVEGSSTATRTAPSQTEWSGQVDRPNQCGRPHQNESSTYSLVSTH